MKEYLRSKEDVLNEVGSNTLGLTFSQANERLEKNGKNKLAEGKKDSLLKRFLSQLADPMIIILIVAAVISAVTAAVGGENEGYADVIIIMFVVLVNAILGVYQESKAEKAIEALQEIAAATDSCFFIPFEKEPILSSALKPKYSVIFENSSLSKFL